MADIFISYSKKDVDTARVIAALLEAQGYSVWWDTSLVAGDQFRRVIMKELEAAKAVVVLWTENSVNSDWVQSEAGRAHNDRKLIPLKARLLTYDKIPPPFDNMHTTNFDNHEALLTAVEAQLAKPPAPPVVWTKVRYEVLTWFGIVGGVLTVVSNLSTFRMLADWMHWLTAHWKTLLYVFWNNISLMIGISITRETALALSAIAFLLSIATGSIFKEGHISRRIGKSYYILIIPFMYVLEIVIYTVINSLLNVLYYSTVDTVDNVILLFPFTASLYIIMTEQNTIE